MRSHQLVVVVVVFSLHLCLCYPHKLPPSIVRSKASSFSRGTPLSSIAVALDDDDVTVADLASERREWRRNTQGGFKLWITCFINRMLADPLMSVVDSLCVGALPHYS